LGNRLTLGMLTLYSMGIYRLCKACLGERETIYSVFPSQLPLRSPYRSSRTRRFIARAMRNEDLGRKNREWRDSARMLFGFHGFLEKLFHRCDPCLLRQHIACN
jgi:hypothetical protein